MSESEISEKEIADTEEDSDSSETETEKKSSSPKTEKDVRQIRKKKATGLNYSAIGIGILFVLPVVCTLVFQAFDFFYPQMALDRLVRGKVLKCYDVAKPNETVDIDKILKKYNGKYQSLFNNLGNKYSKFPECRGLN